VLAVYGVVLGGIVKVLAVMCGVKCLLVILWCLRAQDAMPNSGATWGSSSGLRVKFGCWLERG